MTEASVADATTPYGIKRSLDMSPARAEERIREELKKEGFGILTEIDVKETLKKKLDVDFRPYKILGACNPPLAHEALSEEIDIGLLLPCNVIVYQGDDSESSVVAVLDPVIQLGVAERQDMEPLALEVRKRMRSALEAL